MSGRKTLQERRIADPFLDRRSGDDRREGFEAGYFAKGGFQRRKSMERRQKSERRDQYVRIDKWSSICVNPKSAVAKTMETQLLQAQSETEKRVKKWSP